MQTSKQTSYSNNSGKANTLTIDFSVPKAWHELNDKQLKYLYSLIAKDLSIDEVKALAFLHWSETKVICRYGNDMYLLKHGAVEFPITPLQFATVVDALDWISKLPDMPVRVSQLSGHHAVSADFQGVKFETFLMCENLYQGFISTHRDQFLDEIGTMLYQFSKPHSFNAWQRINIFYWFAALKVFFASRFNEFLQPLSSGNDNLLGSNQSLGAQLQESMDAQIRALTKGDITKEQLILSLDTWRALTELNAQAKEYKLLNDKYNLSSNK
jgi:hypothetical protein